jgi:hypothetical protein
MRLMETSKHELMKHETYDMKHERHEHEETWRHGSINLMKHET